LAKLAGHGGEIKEDIAPELRVAERSQPLLEPDVGRGIGEVARTVSEVLSEVLPNGIIDGLGARELIQSLPQLLPPGGIRFRPTRKADDAEGRGHLSFLTEVVKRGDELPNREVATGSKDDDRAGIDHSPSSAQVAYQRVAGLHGIIHTPTIPPISLEIKRGRGFWQPVPPRNRSGRYPVRGLAQPHLDKCLAKRPATFPNWASDG